MAISSILSAVYGGCGIPSGLVETMVFANCASAGYFWPMTVYTIIAVGTMVFINDGLLKAFTGSSFAGAIWAILLYLFSASASVTLISSRVVLQVCACVVFGVMMLFASGDY